MKSKKIISAITSTLLAVALFVVSIVPASAANNDVITIHPGTNTASGHADRFTAYQIFKGNINDEFYTSNQDEAPLGNITWGDAVDETTIINAMKADNTNFPDFTSYIEGISSTEMNTAQATARWLAKDENKSHVKAFAKLCASNLKADAKGTKSTRPSGDTGDFTIDVPASGYYVVKDTVTTSGENMSASSYIAYVAGNATVTIKSSVPTVTKKVGGNDSALAEIGKDLTFTLTGTVAENIEDYEKYAYEFVDTLPEGLTYNSNAAVTIGGTSVSADDNLTISYDESSRALTVKFTDLKKVSNPTIDKNSQIVVTYTAKLNSKATAGPTGNTNSVKLTYSNDPYSATSTGTTPAGNVKIYTLQLDITKQDGTNSGNLEGVGFVLKKGDQFAKFTNEDSTYAFAGWDNSEGTTITTSSDGTISVKGLDAGTYTLSETQPKKGYDTMADISLTIDASSTDGTLNVTSASIAGNRKDATATVGEDKSIDMTLINYKSAVLPHTGGVGRTMLYVASVITGLLAITVIAVLLRKKKTNNE